MGVIHKPTASTLAEEAALRAAVQNQTSVPGVYDVKRGYGRHGSGYYYGGRGWLTGGAGALPATWESTFEHEDTHGAPDTNFYNAAKRPRYDGVFHAATAPHRSLVNGLRADVSPGYQAQWEAHAREDNAQRIAENNASFAADQEEYARKKAAFEREQGKKWYEHIGDAFDPNKTG